MQNENSVIKQVYQNVVALMKGEKDIWKKQDDEINAGKERPEEVQTSAIQEGDYVHGIDEKIEIAMEVINDVREIVKKNTDNLINGYNLSNAEDIEEKISNQVVIIDKGESLSTGGSSQTLFLQDDMKCLQAYKAYAEQAINIFSGVFEKEASDQEKKRKQFRKQKNKEESEKSNKNEENENNDEKKESKNENNKVESEAGNKKEGSADNKKKMNEYLLNIYMDFINK